MNNLRRCFPIISLIILSSFAVYSNANNVFSNNTEERVWVLTPADNTVTIRLTNNEDDNEKNTKISKKDLKKEIKRRKKHHRVLLSIYNESFEAKYLTLISDNSAKLSNLRELLQT